MIRFFSSFSVIIFYFFFPASIQACIAPNGSNCFSDYLIVQCCSFCITFIRYCPFFQHQLTPGGLINSTVGAVCVNWFRIRCIDNCIGMDFCDVISDDFKRHGDHLLSWDLWLFYIFPGIKCRILYTFPGFPPHKLYTFPALMHISYPIRQCLVYIYKLQTAYNGIFTIQSCSLYFNVEKRTASSGRNFSQYVLRLCDRIFCSAFTSIGTMLFSF